MPILVLTGPAGAGKDFIATELIQRLETVYQRHSFASGLKSALAVLPIEVPYELTPYSIDNSVYFNEADYQKVLTMTETTDSGDTTYPLPYLVEHFGWDLLKPIPYFRRLLQSFGTDMGRNMLDENIWVTSYIENHRAQLTNPDVLNIFTDVRFANELQALKDLDQPLVHVHILNPDGNMLQDQSATHASEHGLEGIDPDITFPNDRTADLEKTVSGLMNQIHQALTQQLQPQMLYHVTVRVPVQTTILTLATSSKQARQQALGDAMTRDFGDYTPQEGELSVVSCSL